jgi:ATP-dependent Clp protease ATP-binding subunit ClpA
MFANLKSKLRSVGTIKSLCVSAEQHALRDQQREPGAEHFLLAALDLPDGTAREAFESIGADAESLRGAIAHQYDDALVSVAIDPQVGGLNDVPEPLPTQRRVYEASASGKHVMQSLADSRQTHNPLSGAHIVAVVAAMKYGVAARALRVMSVDADRLRAAADEIAKNYAQDDRK